MTYDAFLDAVHERIDSDDRDQTVRLAEATLRTLSEILYRTERDRIGAPLPKEMTNLLHAARPQQTRREVERLNPEEFLTRVASRAEIGYPAAREHVPIVFEVLNDAGDGSLPDLVRRLPNEYAVLFPFAERTGRNGPPAA